MGTRPSSGEIQSCGSGIRTGIGVANRSEVEYHDPDAIVTAISALPDCIGDVGNPARSVGTPGTGICRLIGCHMISPHSYTALTRELTSPQSAVFNLVSVMLPAVMDTTPLATAMSAMPSS